MFGHLSLSPDERARVRDVVTALPEEVRAVRAAVISVLAAAVGPFEGRLTRESEVDALLASLIEPITTFVADDKWDMEMLSLIARYAALEARDRFAWRLVVAKRN
jgi:hypothetical protein